MYIYTWLFICIIIYLSVYQTSAGTISWLGQLTDLKGASTGKAAGFAVRATHCDREPPGSPRESESPNNVAIHTPLIDGQSNFEDESHNRNHWKVQFMYVRSPSFGYDPVPPGIGYTPQLPTNHWESDDEH